MLGLGNSLVGEAQKTGWLYLMLPTTALPADGSVTYVVLCPELPNRSQKRLQNR